MSEERGEVIGFIVILALLAAFLWVVPEKCGKPTGRPESMDWCGTGPLKWECDY